jgi:hypothetical protein
MNKILIVSMRLEEREQLEQILQEVIEEGGELLFADRREEALEIVTKEHPQLVFVDNDLAGNKQDWINEGTYVVWMGLAHELPEVGEDRLVKPFVPRQVLDKCHLALNKEPSVEMPPM